MSIQLWADGGVLRTNPGIGGWGVVASSSLWTVSFCGQLGVVTNNVAELVAAVKALQFAHFLAASPYTLYLDSRYVVGVITGVYLAKKNRKLVAIGNQLFQSLVVDVQWVPSKSNRAHRMAQIAKTLL